MPLGVAERPAEREPRAARGETWSVNGIDFQIAPIYRKGEHIGFGALCGQHQNLGDAPHADCKKQLVFGVGDGRLLPQVCRLRVMQWCLMGFEIDPGLDDARKRHVAIDARRLHLWDDARIERGG